MGKLRQKGKAGAAKAYITRTQAIRKLQITLADFRRLCILKGIFPREPRNKKKANKGSTAPTSFYFVKDIAYLAHEPILRKLREHKAFAKKLSRALGRGEWSSAKSLEEQKPVYRLDHIIKERYPTFIDAVRDIDDALCLIFIFAGLPTNANIPASLIESCARLAAEWQLYIMHTRSLRKVFLSIKGVYYQAEVMGELVTWIVPYQFTQTIPTDVDVRVMLTFLELYQTLLGFVFFKLYTDQGLVYPPPIDTNKDNSGAGVGAYTLQEATQLSENTSATTVSKKKVEINGKVVSGKDVKRAIKTIGEVSDDDPSMAVDQDLPRSETIDDSLPKDEEFVVQSSSNQSDPSEAPAVLPTLHSLTLNSSTSLPNLFTPYTFWISRESPRSILEFLIRSFGGKVGWPETVGAGSPFTEDDDSITHVIIDRPSVIQGKDGEEPVVVTKPLADKERRRKFVQPQWVCDCINAGRTVLEEPYARGKVLPPHLSPFGEDAGAYDPLQVPTQEAESESEEEVIEGEELPDEDEEDEQEVEPQTLPAVEKSKSSKKTKRQTIYLDDPDAMRKAELEAERAGIEPAAFEEEVKKSEKQIKKSKVVEEHDQPLTNTTADNPNKMLMSNKQRKLYEKMKYSQRQKEQERKILEQKRSILAKKRKKEGKA